MRISYAANAEDPALKIWWFDDDRTLIDFSGVSSWTLKIGANTTGLLTKTTGIAGAVGAGTEPDGTPNVVVTWSSGELNLPPGVYRLTLVATTAGRDRDALEGTIEIRSVIS
jgi:hypothetical protein